MIKKIFGISAQVYTVALLSIPTILVNSTQTSYAANTSFYCAVEGGVHTTFFTGLDGERLPIVRWVSQFGGLSSKQRCLAVSRNFQKNLDNGTLRTIIDGKINRQPVICAAVSTTDGCNEGTLLFTLKPGSNPRKVLQGLFSAKGLERGEIQSQSGDGSRVAIDFDAYVTALKAKR
jgi:Circadian oscillating protein COP23